LHGKEIPATGILRTKYVACTLEKHYYMYYNEYTEVYYEDKYSFRRQIGRRSV
jgi:hypothetical protein